MLHRIELRARDYLVGEIGPSKWIRWGRLMGLVEAGAIHGYWPAQMVQRVGGRRLASFFAAADREDAGEGCRCGAIALERQARKTGRE